MILRGDETLLPMAKIVTIDRVKSSICLKSLGMKVVLKMHNSGFGGSMREIGASGKRLGTHKLVAILGAALLAISACTKKRPVVNAQGSVDGLVSVSDLENKRYQLKTLGVLAAPNNSEAKSFKVESDPENAQKESAKRAFVVKDKVSKPDGKDEQDRDFFVNNFPLVEWQASEAKLLPRDTPIRGKTNWTYEIRYIVDRSIKRLVVAKVGYPEDIPMEEMRFALRGDFQDSEGRARVAIPIGGYDILGFFRTERIRNSDNEPTNVVAEFTDQTNNPKYLRYEPKSWKLLNAEGFLKDVFPRKYFDDVWYYSEVVVATKVGQEDQIGDTIRAVDTNLKRAPKIRLLLTSDGLHGVNAHIDPRLDILDSKNSESVIFIPYERVDLTPNHQPGYDPLHPSENRNKAPGKKNGVAINFSKTVTTTDQVDLQIKEAQEREKGSDFVLKPKSNSAEKHLVDLEISPNHFAFSLEDVQNGQLVRYDFTRALPRNYKPRRFYAEDKKSFGFFRVYPARVDDELVYLKDDLDKDAFLTRFAPGRDVVYRFAKTSNHDPDLVEIVDQAIRRWNRAHQLAGTGVTVRLIRPVAGDENSTVSLGDGRYNVINIIDSLTYYGQYGFGPTLADPDTGEIVATTANIHVTPLRLNYVRLVRDFLKNELGFVREVVQSRGPTTDDLLRSFGGLSSTAAAPFSLKFQVEVDKNGRVAGLIPLRLETGHNEARTADPKSEESVRAYKNYIEVMQYADSKILPTSLQRRLWQESSPPSPVWPKEIYAKIRKACPALSAYVSAHIGHGSRDSAEENSVVLPCAREMAKDAILATTIHELGHNFGLTHNFKGSADAAHILSSNQLTQYYGLDIAPENISQTSSVMDYMPLDQAAPLAPGAYDIEALRFGYAGQVKMTSGPNRRKQMVSIQDDESISQALERQGGGQLENYAFCTDDDEYFGKDPMCAKHDYGTTPEAVIDYLTKSYWSHVAMYNFRYDRSQVDPRHLTLERYFRIFLPLRRFYDEWRFILKKKWNLSPNGQYLAGYDLDTYIQKIQKSCGYSAQTRECSNAPEYAEFSQWYRAQKKISDFFWQVAFMPNEYCVTVGPNGEVVPIELSRLRQEIENTQNETFIKSCDDPKVKNSQYLKSRGLVFIKQIGYPLESVHYSSAIRDSEEPVDVVGTYFDRLNAFRMFTKRISSSKKHLDENFSPNVIDDPIVRQSLTQKLLTRITIGENLSAYLNDVPGGQNAKNTPFNRFSAERKLLLEQYSSLLQDLATPGSIADTMKIRKPYHVVYKDIKTPDLAAAGYQSLPVPGGFIFAKPSENVVATEIIQSISAIDTALAVMQLDKGKQDILFRVLRSIGAEAEKLLPQGNGASPVSGETFVKFMAFVQNEITAPDVSDAVNSFISTTVLQPYINVFDNKFRPAIAGGESQAQHNAGQGLPDVVAQLNRQSASKLSDLLIANVNEEFPPEWALSAKNIRAKTDQYINYWPQTVDTFTNEIDGPEIDEQKSLMTDILLQSMWY